jgi:zinc/manganese transport system permease protein
MFSFPFMQNAFVVGTLIAIVSGALGVFVVARQMAFLTHVLGEIGFAGAAFGLFMSWSPLVGMALFTTAAATMVGQLGAKQRHADAVIATVSSVAIGLGVAFLALAHKNASAATSILFGSIFSIDHENVLQVCGLSVIVLALLVLIFRPLRHYAFDFATAQYTIKHVDFLGIVFLVLMALTVAVSAQIVGSLLIFILMTIPASAALRWGGSPQAMVGRSVFFALLGVWSALVLAYVTDMPVSFFIAMIEAGIYLVTLALTRA